MKKFKILFLMLFLCGSGVLFVQCSSDPLGIEPEETTGDEFLTRFPTHIVGPSQIERGEIGTFYVAPSLEYPNYVTWSIQGSGATIVNSTDTFAQVRGYVSGNCTLVATVRTLGGAVVSTLTYSFQIVVTSVQFYIQFESEHQMLIDIMLELGDGGYIDLFTGELDRAWDYYDGVLYRYRETIDLPPGDHVFYISTNDYPRITSRLPFTLTERGGGFMFYFGDWGGGGMPSFVYNYL